MRLDRFLQYGRFIKIEHTLFSFPLLLSGALLAREPVLTVRTLVLILVAGAGARAAALSLNRILDRAIDARNPRTASRELPRGSMSLFEGWFVTLIGTIVYALAAFWISPRCLALAPLPLAVFVVYPLLKRVTPWAHLGVGAGLSLAPLGAWYAVSLSFANVGPALVLSLFVFFWVAGFDVIYATLDEEFDRKSGIHSLPAWLGKKKALGVSLAFHLAAFLCLGVLYWRELSGLSAFLLLLVVGGLLLLEHRKAEDVELAFFKINAVLGFVVLAFVYAGVSSVSP